jgi:hypothetical protein
MDIVGVAPPDDASGDVAATEVTVPVVGVVHVNDVPLDVNTCPLVPTVVKPVPPNVVGTVERERSGVVPPEDTIGEVAVTDVTGVGRVTYCSVDPLDESTCPFVPTVVRPVPPNEVGTVEREIFGVLPPDELIGELAVTAVNVPDVGVVQFRVVPLDVSTCPLLPTVVKPVPPRVVGTVDKLIVGFAPPDELIGDEPLTDVTVPVVGVDQNREVPFDVNT